MAKQKEVVYRIHKDGRLEVETVGMSGKEECSKVINHIYQSLGGTIISDEKKPEYWDDDQKVHTNIGR